MTQVDVGVVALVMFVVVSVVIVVKRANENAKLGLLTAAGLLCLGLFLIVNVLDWPGATLSTFWAQHAIVAATVSTIPLAGVGFFAFKHYDTSVQSDLDEKIAGTGRSGVVNHLVDVDLALAMLPWTDERIAEWRPPAADAGRPLRWLREKRSVVGRKHPSTDPRLTSVGGEICWGALQGKLMDESVRRLMAGIRDWGPLLARSRQGERDLIKLGDLRRELLSIEDRGHCTSTQIVRLQATCREVAWDFESKSSPKDHRPELIPPTEAGDGRRRPGQLRRRRARRAPALSRQLAPSPAAVVTHERELAHD